MIRALALVLLVVVLVLQMGSESTRVSIIRPTRFLYDDQSSRWWVRVEPHDEHRWLVLAAMDEGGPVRSSREQLDGANAPRTRWIDWRSGLPAGDYRVVAIVYSQSKEVARASVPLTVLARF